MVTEVAELDSVGRTVCSYLISEHRVDIVRPQRRHSLVKNAWEQVLAVFLPVGYPHSVTGDYAKYQIYDSLQAFSSSIAGLLSSRAVLEGVGVGDANASPTAALLLTIIQDSAGRVGTILFAHRFGTALEPECKKWRLAADIFNDAAMIIDCLSPAFPRTTRVLLLSTASTLRALCGVAAGSAKASLSTHFAKWGNLGELNAKDSSQETIISLLGMLTGSIVVGYITTPIATWLCLLTLLSIHLATNYLAVRAVTMRTLNRQRANLVFSRLLTDGAAMSPEAVADIESIFERDGVLRWSNGPILAFSRVGTTLEALINLLRAELMGDNTLTPQSNCPSISAYLAIFQAEPYLMWYSPQQRRVAIVFKDDDAETHLKAWMHGLLIVHSWQSIGASQKTQGLVEVLETTLTDINRSWRRYLSAMRDAGWDLGTANIETTSGSRLRLDVS